MLILLGSHSRSIFYRCFNFIVIHGFTDPQVKRAVEHRKIAHLYKSINDIEDVNRIREQKLEQVIAKIEKQKATHIKKGVKTLKMLDHRVTKLLGEVRKRETKINTHLLSELNDSNWENVTTTSITRNRILGPEGDCENQRSKEKIYGRLPVCHSKDDSYGTIAMEHESIPQLQKRINEIESSKRFVTENINQFKTKIEKRIENVNILQQKIKISLDELRKIKVKIESTTTIPDKLLSPDSKENDMMESEILAHVP